MMLRSWFLVKPLESSSRVGSSGGTLSIVNTRDRLCSIGRCKGAASLLNINILVCLYILFCNSPDQEPSA